MATKAMKFVRGSVARFTRLDGCGRPIYGDASTVITKGWVSVGFTANIDSGSEINVPNAAGERCVYEPAVPRLTGHTIEVTFCEVDPELYAMATGQDVVLDAAGNVVGFDVDTAVSTGDAGFALEVWAKSPAQACTSEVAQGSFGYFLVPFLQGGTLGDMTIGNDAVSFTLSNATTKEGNGWGVGPYDVILNGSGDPSPLLVPVSPTLSLRPMVTELAPPEPALGARPLLDRTDAALTGLTVTNVAKVATYTPTPASTDPWWIDFGDGTWDYSPTGAALVHTFATAGTYPYVARRGNSVRTGSATVTA